MKARVTRGGPTPSSRVPAPKASPRASPRASPKVTRKATPKENPKAVATRTAAAASALKMTGSNRRPPKSSHESGRFQRHTSDNLDYLIKESEDDGTPAGNGGNSRGASDADGGIDLLATRSVSIDEFMRASDMVEKNLEALSQALDRSMNAPDLPRRPSIFSSSGSSGARQSISMSEQTIAHVFSLRMRGEEQQSLGKAQGGTGDNGNAVDLDSPRPGSDEEGASLTAAELKELGVVDLDGADDDDDEGGGEGGGENGNAAVAVAVAASKTNNSGSGNGIGSSRRPDRRNGCGATDEVNDEVTDEVWSLKEKLKAAQEKVVLLEADNASLRTSLQSTEGQLSVCESAREGAEGRCSTQQADLQKAQVLIRETLRQVWDLKNSARHHRQSLPVSPGSADSTENPLVAMQGDQRPAMPKPRILL